MNSKFVKVASVKELNTRKRLVVKVDRKQIALFLSDTKILACNNRCPHEGYPLSEGSLTKDCILTCNWHNWKFDLITGDTMVGGDQLRIYETKVIGDDIFLDVKEPPVEVEIEKTLGNLKASFKGQEYDRMAREIARLQKVGGDPLEAVRQAIQWTHDRFEYGMTHAFAAAQDWLKLRDDTSETASEKLVPLLETVGHMSWDSLREPKHSFTNKSQPFNSLQFETALEDEDEDQAISLLNGALKDAVDQETLFSSLRKCALAHYADFGHSAIYTYKTQQLIETLGPTVIGPLLKALVRSLIFARREELLPEFKRYTPALNEWEKTSSSEFEDFSLEGKNVNQSLAHTLAHSREDPENLYPRILHQLARNMLYFKADLMEKWDKPVSYNITWLAFSHGLTFSNAARTFCEKTPQLWPQTLLQMACFSGRNAAYVDFSQNMEKWYVDDTDAFLKEAKKGLLDHANPEFLISSHLVKVVTAVAEEVRQNPEAVYIQDLIAATNRFLNSPFKRKHTKRTATQSIEFVAREG
ncbi:MAG: Rieske (2Fe-2S) protein [Sneathiella sp.]